MGKHDPRQQYLKQPFEVPFLPLNARLTFWLRDYIWSLSCCSWVVVRDLREWRPGFYSEFRYRSREHSGLASVAVLREMYVLILIPISPCSFFKEQVPKMDSFASLAIKKEHGDTNIHIYILCIYIYMCVYTYIPQAFGRHTHSGAPLGLPAGLQIPRLPRLKP